MNRGFGVSMLVAALAFGGGVSAQEAEDAAGGADQIEEVDRLQVILEQQREVASMLDGDGIDGLTTRENNRVRKAQQEVFAVTEGKSRLDDLSIDDKVRLENALEQINALVKNTRLASDDQNVCWRERKSGTTIKVTRCGTQAERDRIREGARAWMEKPSICTPPGCGSGS
jgi:hypothetical protein